MDEPLRRPGVGRLRSRGIVDADLGGCSSRERRPGSGARLQRRAPRRARRPWLAGAGGAGAVVLAAGLLWPTAAGRPGDGRWHVEPTMPPLDPCRARAGPDPADAPWSDRRRSTARRTGASSLRSAPPIWRRSPTRCSPLARVRGRAGMPGAACSIDADAVIRRRASSICRRRTDRVTLLDDFGGAAVLRVGRAAGAHRLSSWSSCSPTTDGCCATCTTSRSSLTSVRCRAGPRTRHPRGAP